MTDNRKEEVRETKLSTDTLFVLLLVICGIAAIILVAYLLYKPHQSNNVIRDIVVSGIVAEDSGVFESIDDSLEDTHLDETPDEIVITEEAPEVPEVKEPEPVVEAKPIFKPSTGTIKKTATKSTVVKKPVTKQKLVTVKAYWIQVGSFSSSSQANRTVELLKERGLSSRVVLKTVDGKSVYRVRIGAYESREEAQKFCDEVKKIPGYEDSYVSEATTQKYVDV